MEEQRFKAIVNELGELLISKKLTFDDVRRVVVHLDDKISKQRGKITEHALFNDFERFQSPC